MRRYPSELSSLEISVLIQVILFICFSSWALGGNIWWAEIPMQLIGSIGMFLTVFAILKRRDNRILFIRALLLITPLAFLNILVLLSSINPNHYTVSLGEQTLLAQGRAITWLPSTAMPSASISSLLLLDGIYLSSLNIYLVINQRHALRYLLMAFTANTFILSILGSLQKLGSAKGPYFGLIKSPNPYFFSTFLYHNHWGPFVILSIAGCLGLSWYFSLRISSTYRDFWHSPAFQALVMVFFLTAAIAMSASRSSTLLVIIFLLASFGIWVVKTGRNKLENLKSITPLISIGTLTLTISIIAIIWIAQPMMSTRIEQTTQEVNNYIAGGSLGNRHQLYGDVIRMAKDRPWFGWGMGSFPYVFQSYNSQTSLDSNNLRFYADAHSDVLQAFAEHGTVGTIVIAFLAILPLILIWPLSYNSITIYALAGCAIVLFHSLFEFPFGCPAVVLLWWVSFFTALRISRLESSK